MGGSRGRRVGRIVGGMRMDLGGAQERRVKKGGGLLSKMGEFNALAIGLEATMWNISGIDSLLMNHHYLHVD